jgi:hypothetical protein
LWVGERLLLSCLSEFSCQYFFSQSFLSSSTSYRRLHFWQACLPHNFSCADLLHLFLFLF